jgi:hypothetical protein
VFVLISVHKPRPDKEKFLIDSMHRYGEACRKHKGLVFVETLKDARTGELVGLAVWDSEVSYMAAKPDLAKATEGDDFDAWESVPVRGHRLTPV